MKGVCLLPVVLCLVMSAGASAARAEEPARWTKEDCDAFMRELAQYIYDHHLKKDERSEQKGMIYEYFYVKQAGKVDQYIQGEGLDTMHDGAWFASALAHAYRATADAWYLDFLKKYQMPFYAKILNNSDVLFTDLAGAWSDGKAWPQPAKPERGFCPYWWDDGGSVSLDRRMRTSGFPKTDRLLGKDNPDHKLDGYSHGTSNHMAQDLAVMLLQGWLMTRDPQLAEAAKNLYDSRWRHFPGHIPVVTAAAGLTNNDEAILKHVPAPKPFEPFGWSYRIIYNFKPGERYTTQGFTDDDEYIYFYTLARNRTIDRETARRLIYLAVTNPLCIYYWHDVTPYRAGINRLDLQSLYAKDGKLEQYESGGKPLAMGSRMGPQSMVTAAWALQLLKTYPACWLERFPNEAVADVLAPMTEMTPAVDETRDPVYGKAVEFPEGKLSFASDLRNLFIYGEVPQGEAATLTLFAGPAGQGTSATVAVTRRANMTALNDQGRELVFEGKINPSLQGFTFEVKIPYTIVKVQERWANGIEHGRLSVKVGDTVKNLYLLSTEQAVVARLERELDEGLANWRAIFREKGYIPTGMGPTHWWAQSKWEDFSDSGGYAHLISAAAMYRMYLDGRKDWEEALK